MCYIYNTFVARTSGNGGSRDWNQLGNLWQPVAVAVAASPGVALIDSAA